MWTHNWANCGSLNLILSTEFHPSIHVLSVIVSLSFLSFFRTILDEAAFVRRNSLESKDVESPPRVSRFICTKKLDEVISQSEIPSHLAGNVESFARYCPGKIPSSTRQGNLSVDFAPSHESLLRIVRVYACVCARARRGRSRYVTLW